mmetsp:Transcript_16765/g.31116  ORF Transcript_16765/g.31116 Transcript_16765/m.31116 type:complete len:225 (+) Transcript_16765:130-804(+)
MTRVTAHQILRHVVKQPERVCRDDEVLEDLEEFRGSPNADQVQDVIEQRLQSHSDFVARRLGKLNSRIPELKEKCRSLDLRCRDMSQQLDNMQYSNSDGLQADLSRIRNGKHRFEKELEETQNRCEHLSRLQVAMLSVSQHLKKPKILVVTVQLDTSLGPNMVTCSRMSGEQISCAQPVDVTIGELAQAVSKTAPDMYVQFVSSDGMFLDCADDDAVKKVLRLK